MTSTQQYQHNYYLLHRDELRKRHREYGRKVRQGEIVPHPKKLILEQWQHKKCDYCSDLIFGHPYTIMMGGRRLVIDSGCFLLLKSKNLI